MPEPVSAACFFTAKVTMLGFQEVASGWTKIDGLGFTIQKEEREIGGVPFFKKLLIKGIQWGEITLTRPVQPDSQLMRGVISGTVSKFMPVSAEITLKTPDGADICSWQLMNCTIVGYKGPSLGVTNTGVAEESIVLHHEGLLETLIGQMAGAALGAVGL